MKTRTGLNGSGRYYIVDESTGLALPSVTTIIGETSDKSGLIEWENKVGKEEAARISKFSANRGTYMHTLHENYINCKYIENVPNLLQETFKRTRVECSTLTPEEMECGKDLFFNYLYRSDFYNQIKEVIFQEVPVWSIKGGGYAGRLDLSIVSIEDKKKIIDFKTSRRPKKKEWITNYFKQIAAYSVGMFEQYGIFPDECEIWISCETGDVQIFRLNQKEIKYWFNEFYKDVLTYHSKHKNN